MSWDILPKENLQYFLQKLKGKFDGKADNSNVTEVDTSNTTPFLYRQTPHNADGVFLDELVGGSVGVNQLVQNGNFADTSNWSLYDSSKSTLSISNNIAKVVYKSSSTSELYIYGIIQREFAVNRTHKILICFDVLLNYDGNFGLDTFGGYNSISCNANVWSYFAVILNENNPQQSANILLRPTSDVTQDNYYQVKNVNIIDLTQWFGTTIADYIYSLEWATAGSGIAWLKSYGFFTKDYYPYNTGELISVKTSGKKYVGKNRFDTNEMDNDSGTVGVGTYDGQISHIPSTMFANYPFKANTQYTLSYKGKNTTTAQTNFRFVINYTDGTSLNVGNVQTSEYVSISGTSASGKTIQSIGRDYSTGGSISLKDLMLEEGSTATAYESYTETTYDISNIDLRGVPKLVNNELVYDGDTYESNGDVTRKYGIVDLGEKSYSGLQSGTNAAEFFFVLNTLKKNTANVISNKFVYKNTYTDVAEYTMRTLVSDGYSLVAFKFPKSVVSTNEAAKQWMQDNDVVLDYELATPTTETADPYTNPQICDKDGTEEFIDDRTVPIPVGHNSRYADLPAIMDGDYLSYMARNFASEEYVDTKLGTKVDKVTGKGLSTNDYTNEEKALVTTIPDKADSDDVKGTQTVSGNPITLTDASETYAQALSVELEPVQDLHGYDFPWVGGAGKNKLPMVLADIKSANTDGTWSGNTYTVSGASFTVLTDNDGNVVGIQSNNGGSASISLPFTLKAGTYIMSSGFTETAGTNDTLLFDSNNTVIARGSDYTPGQQFTLSSDSSVRWTFRVTTASNLCKPMIRLSTETDSTFAPYSNICPISGLTEVDVESVGHNQWNEEWEVGALISDGSVDASLTNRRTTSFIQVQAGETYYQKSPQNARWGRHAFYDKNKNCIYYNGDGFAYYFTAPENAKYIRITFNLAYGTTYNHDISINYPSTDRDYHSYHSSNVTIQFGQTVYGGRSNFTDGGTKRTKIKDTIPNSWDINANHDVYWLLSKTVSVLKQVTNSDGYVRVISDKLRGMSASDCLTSRLPYTIAIISNSRLYMVLKKSDFATLSDVNTWCSEQNIEICYEVETPTQLFTPPTELKLLKGTNNITTNGTTINLGYQPNNPLGDVLQASEEYTDRQFAAFKFGWKVNYRIENGASLPSNVDYTKYGDVLFELMNQSMSISYGSALYPVSHITGSHTMYVNGDNGTYRAIISNDGSVTLTNAYYLVMNLR